MKNIRDDYLKNNILVTGQIRPATLYIRLANPLDNFVENPFMMALFCGASTNIYPSIRKTCFYPARDFSSFDDQPRD